jgi:hypothetical protein
VFDVLPRHEARQELGTFVQHLSALDWVDDLSEPAQFASRVDAKSQAEDDAARREVVERYHLASQHLGAPSHDRGHHRAEAQAGRGTRDAGEDDPRISDVGSLLGAPQHVVPEEEPIPALLLCEDGKRDHSARIGQLVERRQEYSVAHDRGDLLRAEAQ